MAGRKETGGTEIAEAAVVGGTFSVDKFVESFPVLVEAAGGTKKLRELAIEFACRGLLLGERSKAEWRSLLVADVVADFQNGISKRKGETGSPLPVLRLADIEAGTSLRSDSLREITLTKAEQDKYRVDKGDILVIRVNGSADLVGRFIPCDVQRPWAYSDHLIRLRLRHDIVDTRFLCAISRSASARIHIDSKTVSTAGQRTINQTGLGALPLSLPPLAEQKRIVARVDQLMALIDQLEAKQNRKRDLGARYTKASLEALTTAESPQDFTTAWTRLHSNWPTLLDHPDKVAHLRKIVFGLACRGVLTAPEPGETGQEILAKVEERRMTWAERESRNGNSEATRLLRKLEEPWLPKAPLPCPSSWATASLLQASWQVVDCHNKTAPYSSSGVMLVRTTNIRDGVIRLDGIKHVTADVYERWSRRCPPQPGDLLLTREAPVGEVGLVEEGMKLCMGQRMMLIRTFRDLVDPRYLVIALRDPAFLGRMNESSIGMTVKHLRVGDVESLLVPIPPYDEQKRIVAKVEHLMKLCDALEAALRRREDRAAKLAEAVVQEMVA